MMRSLSFFILSLLIVCIQSEKTVPDLQDGCYKDLQINILFNATIKNSLVKCLKNGDPEAYKSVPGFPETIHVKMSPKMIEECEDTFKWIANVEMCLRTDLGAYDPETEQLVPWRINEMINQLLTCSDQKKDMITSIIDLCFAEVEDKKGWEHVLLFNACKFWRLSEICPENKYLYEEWQRRNAEWKNIEEDGDVLKEITNQL